MDGGDNTNGRPELARPQPHVPRAERGVLESLETLSREPTGN
jgi:hypothetical protein